MRLVNLSVLALAAGVTAYPSILEAVVSSKPNEKRQASWSPNQKVDVSGSHAFIAPGSSDRRGPCPGLNALANHGYLPRNGVGTVTQFVQATNTVFGMGVDLGSLLSALGAVMSGDLVSWSIGGPPPSSILGPLLGQPQGISNSHNKYETDASPTRGDLYQYGNNVRVQISQFENLYNRQAGVAPGDVNFNTPILDEFRKTRLQQSVAGNPYFYSGVNTYAVATAASLFIYRMFANHTAEHPDGILNREVLKSFFAISGEPGSFTYNEGYERIPQNWYRRAYGDEYTIAKLAQEIGIVSTGSGTSSVLIGGNTGATNSFVGLNLNDFTGGVYNAQNLAQGNNIFCLAFQAGLLLTPDFLKGGIFGDIVAAVNYLATAVNSGLAGLGCPQLNNIDESLLQQYPGYTRSVQS